MNPNFHNCLLRFHFTLLIVGSSLFVISLAYGILPEMFPLHIGLPSLAIYTFIGIISITLLAVYLGDGD